ncbi:MAG: hypothetical protein AB1465_02850 [Patescibacteria group bacterium]
MDYSYSITKISQILRARPEALLDLQEKMSELTNKKGVLERIVAENDFKVKQILGFLKLTGQESVDKIYNALIKKLKDDDADLFEILGKPKCTTQENCGSLISKAKELADVGKGFFLKKEKACELLCSYPPKNILKSLGYKTTEALLEKEDFREIYCALRFIESPAWMREFLTKYYKNIKKTDFEEREIKVFILDGKWLKIAEKFIQKKYHNVSHLKELGIIFIIPLPIDTPGEILRVFSLLLHYLHEVDFYSKLFVRYSKEENFVNKFVSALRGDVLEKKLHDGYFWRIVQRYLAKDDVNDFRLFESHVNPEAIHWYKAENDLSKLDAQFPDLDFTFWRGLDFVGDFFKYGKHIGNNLQHREVKENNGEVKGLLSLNLIDNIMSLVKEKEMVKYLYHHQEALWNEIFAGYLGHRNMEKLIIENFDRGYIDEIQARKLFN